MRFQQNIQDLQGLNFMQNTSLRVGIFGGTFNPAHLGHLSIAMRGINFYKFDYIIWLVANQNTLKKKNKKSIFERAETILQLTNHPRMIISTAEYELGYCHTYDSLHYFVNRFTNVKFTWLMGIDNLINFHKWDKYQEIQKLCDIIIFDRPEHNRLVNINSFGLKLNPVLAKSQTHSIIIDRNTLCDISSTKIRAK